MTGILKSKKMEGFAQAFVLHGNATQAYRDNYNTSRLTLKSLNQSAARLTKHPKVKLRIAELRAIAAKIAEDEFSVDARWLLKRFIAIDGMDVADILDPMGNVLPVREWPTVWRKTIAGVDVSEISLGGGDDRQAAVLRKIKWPDKLKNLELLGRHVDVQAFKDNLVIPPGAITLVINRPKDGG